MAEALVRFEGVRKAYGPATGGYAVKQLDLEVRKGELLTYRPGDDGGPLIEGPGEPPALPGAQGKLGTHPAE